MLRIGLAGLGFMGMVHYLSYARVRGVKVAAVSDVSAKRRAGDWRDIKGNFGPPGEQIDLSGVAAYEMLDEMFADESLDAVDLCLPPALHADAAIRAMKAGKHVFCEKPMALTLKDCDRMQRAAEQHDRLLMIGHVLPYFPEYAWALKEARSGKHGKLLGGAFKRVISDPAWLKNFWKADQVGGPMLDLHVHDAHFIRLLFGMPTSLVTSGRMRGGLAEHWNTQFEYGDMSPAVTATSGVIDQQGRPFQHAFELHFEHATLVFDFAVIGDRAEYLCPPTILTKSGKAREAKLSGGDPMDAFYAEVKEVTRCLQQETPSEVLGGELARDAIQLCQRQTKSLETGRRVKM